MLAFIGSILAGIVIGAFVVAFLICAAAKHVMGKALGW